ncbi:PREDICTED: LOW QUALITY PROTEIN: protein disulfide-isomerase A5-like [Acropora digitifera]|uniref:LOW QUALITY PROTEIN: protein disulfide-isomerase A5-like n=1 Tax=Acropora digitifera TaxID=70779 RepID=UPI00077B19BA|nr:PREDICTED: LOW QUALITY PROTEIN: protein disulfide-isomerase A5-like [Acropora digitifera]
MAEKKTSIIISLLLILFAEPSLQGKKKLDRSSIIEINDVKSFKKLQRTHTNLLVIFAQSDNDASSKFEVLVQAAEEIKGKGTIAYINCGGTKDSKKLCKKLKVSPKPVVLKHYKDGDFNKDFDRKHTLKSVLNFLNDPTGEMPWEEEDGAEDVKHIKTVKDFDKLTTKEKRPLMVMFYAPWCGFCKKLKPDFALAATELKPEAVSFELMLTPLKVPVREKYNITGFPTLIYFENGEEKYRYQGKYDKDSIVDWMRNPTPSAPPRKEEDQWKDEPSDVVHLSDSTFDDFVISNPSVLVMFYAPWCGHCKAMKPAYTEAAQTMKEQQIPGVLAAVDATKEQEIGKRYKIEGFPTVKYFKDGEVAFDVNERLFTICCIPVCGHCVEMKPAYFKAAEILSEELPSVSLAALDCLQHKDICRRAKIRGYPTARYFRNGEFEIDYDGDRSVEDIVNFMKSLAYEDKGASVEEKGGEEKKQEAVEEPREIDGLKILTEANFETFLSQTEHVLVMFYAPWCSHCQSAKPTFLKASEAFAKEPSKAFTAVDCSQDADLCDKQDVSGYPTIKYFKYGAFLVEYDGDPTEEDFIAFMTSPPQPLPPDQPGSDAEDPRDEL